MKYVHILFMSLISLASFAQEIQPEMKGWAENSVNAVIFRNNSIVTYKDTQFIAYYDADGYLCLGKRTGEDSPWQLSTTNYQGNKEDAHNCISIMVDGAGYLHVAWNHHDSPLNYTKTQSPLSLDLEEPQAMTGKLEDKVTYPGFYQTTDGNLLFLYREGQSGKGNLVLNTYDINTQKWTQIQDNLIDGEGERSAYWQTCIDKNNVIHLSWVWRESPDVASNHDMCYAKSRDDGKTWTDSKGNEYQLPITAKTAEQVAMIPQNSELINQTSMTTDNAGNPYIATYYRKADTKIPQYHIIYLDDAQLWQDISLGFRTTPFTLSGGGTKKIPISRPQILCYDTPHAKQWLLIFRDVERGNKVTIANITDLSANKWAINNLTATSVGDWEPTYDTELWKQQQKLNIFAQKVGQEDGEQNSALPAQTISVLNVSFEK